MTKKIKRKKEFIMNHKQKGIIVRLSDEEFHALNEKVEMSGLPRQTYVRKLIHGVIPDGKISEEWHTVFRTLDLIRNHIHLLILFGAGENSNQLQKLKDYRSWITKVEFGLDKGFVWKWYKEDKYYG
jgi:hypothetical protein